MEVRGEEERGAVGGERKPGILLPKTHLEFRVEISLEDNAAFQKVNDRARYDAIGIGCCRPQHTYFL